MTLRTGLAVVVLLLAPLSFASGEGVCAPFGFGAACVNVDAGASGAAADAFLSLAPIVLSYEWRSAHVVAGVHGAGAGVHGNGASTGGPFDLWASASPTGAQAGTYLCLRFPPIHPGSCGDVIRNAAGLVPVAP